MEFGKVTANVRKAKKKQVKDDVDRIKLAEKKKKRLEKALATSAAIRSELEKKKLKKKKEQERLEEEGAAIAEAVALHVLLGEDSDNLSGSMIKKGEELTSWDHTRNIRRQPLLHYNSFSKYSSGCIALASDTPQYGHIWNIWGNCNCYPQYVIEGWGPVGLAADHLAAQAVSALKIGDDARRDALTFNHILRG